MIAVGTMMSADKRRYWPWWCWPTMTTTATTTTTTTTKMLSNISNDHNRTQRISSSSSAAASTTYLILVLNSLLLLLSHVDCDIDSGSNIFNHSKPFYFSTKANPPNVTRRAVDNVVPTSSSAFDTNRTHQPLINLSKFCSEPPTVANAQSNLKRNQKHFVWTIGTKASYMCEQGYVAVGVGNAETRCTLVPEEDGHGSTSSSGSSIIFPGRIRRNDYMDMEHHLITLEMARHNSRINSKRLYAIDADEETETNANSATSANRFDGVGDKRKSSRKHGDDFMFYETDNVMGRHGGGHDEKEAAATTSKQNRAEKGDEIRSVRWWPPVTLNCQLVNCTDPGEVENARRRDPPGTVFSFNSNVQYECLPGYEPVGIPIMTCRANGQWNRPPPKCKPIQCQALPVLENGKIFYSNPERIIESKAEYHCNEGYKLNAVTMTRVCRPDGQWASLEPLLGQLIPSSVADRTNGTVSESAEPYQCQPIQCPLPPRPHFGLRIVPLKRKNKNQPFKPGDLIFFTCDTLKTRVPFSSKCRSDGEWTRLPPDCPPPKECPPLPTTIDDGNVTMKSLAMAKFTCADGFELRGASVLTCSIKTGEWSAALPSCVREAKAGGNIASAVAGGNIGGQANNGTNADKNAKEGAHEISAPDFDDDDDEGPSRLTYLLLGILLLAAVVGSTGFLLYRRWRHNLQQRRRWQQYFGHYHNRQSRTNIIMSSTHGNGVGSARASADISTTGAKLNGNGGGARNMHARKSIPNSTKPLATIAAAASLLQSSSFSSADESGIETIKSDKRNHTITTYADTVIDVDEEIDEDSEGSEYYESISTTSPPPPSQPPPSMQPSIYATRDKVIPVTDL